MTTDFEAKVLEEITKIRETLAMIVERDRSTQSRISALEQICGSCPARSKWKSWTGTAKDLAAVAGVVTAIWAALQIVSKIKGLG
jgi:succinate dehydrogenase/fumarate reductase-like Fe-S protein